MNEKGDEKNGKNDIDISVSYKGRKFALKCRPLNRRVTEGYSPAIEDNSPLQNE